MFILAVIPHTVWENSTTNQSNIKKIKISKPWFPKMLAAYPSGGAKTDLGCGGGVVRRTQGVVFNIGRMKNKKTYYNCTYSYIYWIIHPLKSIAKIFLVQFFIFFSFPLFVSNVPWEYAFSSTGAIRVYKKDKRKT